ncbi:MAG TPA: hypothetical protein VH723_06215, partial [Candidatus Limnocylindrales bacterium]
MKPNRIGAFVCATALAWSAFAMALANPATSGVRAHGGGDDDGVSAKIHRGADEPSHKSRSYDEVCTFHVHFIGDHWQSGAWWIKRAYGAVVLSGAYQTGGDGEDRHPTSGAYELRDGWYKLYWRAANGDDTDSRPFRVECDDEHDGSPKPSHSYSPKPSHSGSPRPSHSASPSPSGSPKPSHSGSPRPSHSASPSPSGSPKPSH